MPVTHLFPVSEVAVHRFIGASVLVLTLGLSHAAHAETWFRLNMDSPILYTAGSDADGGSPDLGGNNPIEFIVNGDLATTSVDGRELGNLNIPVTAKGIDSNFVVEVAALPSGATWNGTSIVWPSAANGSYTPVIEVRDSNGALVASQSFELTIHLPLSASVPQTSYQVSVGDTLSITPGVANLIADGAVKWGASLPSWLDLNESNGTVAVDTSAVRSADDLVLTAVDQIDLAHASTAPFSVSVNKACEAWTLRAASEQSTWVSVAYGGGQFIALSSASGGKFMTSADGIGWTVGSMIASSLASVTYGDGLFVAVTTNGANRVLTSPDGFNWTRRTTPELNSWVSVAYGAGRFVAVASSGTNRIMTSTDGVSWTAVAAPEQNSWMSVTYGGGRFVAVAGSGTNRIMTSIDGLNWSPVAAPAQSVWRSVTYGGGQFVAVAQTGTKQIMTSPNGISWTARAAPEENNWSSVTYGDGGFVAVANSGTSRIMKSNDGVNWTKRSSPEQNGWWSVAYGAGRFAAVGSSGTNRIMTSDCF